MTSETPETQETLESLESPETPPLRYNLIDFNGPFAQSQLQQNIDPNNNLKAVKLEFKGDKVREFYWRRLLKDVESSKTTTDLSSSLVNAYETLGRTKAIKNLGITFEPNDEGTVKVVMEPQFAKRFTYGINHSHLLESFGFLGVCSLGNVTGLLDSISLNLVKGTYGNLKSSYFVNYLLPVFYKNYSLELAAGRQSLALNRSVSETSAFQVLRFFTSRTSFLLTHSQRWNVVDYINHSREVIDQDIYPGRKISLTATRTWPILDPNKNWANVVQLKGTIGAVEGAGKFLKQEFGSHALLYPRFLGLTGRLSELCFENHFVVGAVVPLFGSKLKINERFYRTDFPGFSEIVNPVTTYDKNLHPKAGNQGFEYLGDHKGDDVFLKNTFKIDFKECPILKKVDIVPFLYASYGYFSGDVMSDWMKKREGQENNVQKEEQSLKKRYSSLVEELKKKSRVSVGVGLFKTINYSFNIEGLLNLYSVGTPSDKLARFQMRLTINE